MIPVTRLRLALIATAASMLTSAMHGSIQAIFSSNFDSILNVAAYVFGRVIGDIPLAIICFVITFAISMAFKTQSSEPHQ